MIMRAPVGKFIIDLNDNETADALWLALPLDVYLNQWGCEVYFEIPVEMPLENGRREMGAGEVGYWPQGRALCIFYGPTPLSTDDKAVAVDPVTPLGMVREWEGLKALGDRMWVHLERHSD